MATESKTDNRRLALGSIRLTYERVVIAILVAAVLSCAALFLGYFLTDLGDEPRNLYCRPTTAGNVEGLVICNEEFPTE